MDQHLTVLGALFLVLGVLGLVGMGVVFAIFSIGSAVLGAAAAQDPDVPAVLTMLPAAFGTFICTMIAVGVLPALVAGYGLLRRRAWARVWMLVAGVVNLPNIPLGTGVGIYAIWAFLQEGTATALAPRS